MDAGLNETRMKMLGEIAELGLVLARDLQQAAVQAEDPADKVRLASAFHRIGRGVRQSLALHARLERDLERAGREDQAQVVSLDQVRRARRKAHLKGAVEALIWTEQERFDDPEDLVDRLDAILSAEADTDAFLDEPPDAAIARLRDVLNLPLPSEDLGEGRVRAGACRGFAPDASPRALVVLSGVGPAGPHPTLSRAAGEASGGAEGSWRNTPTRWLFWPRGRRMASSARFHPAGRET